MNMKCMIAIAAAAVAAAAGGEAKTTGADAAFETACKRLQCAAPDSSLAAWVANQRIFGMVASVVMSIFSM